jgi:hypothetical protein
VLQRYVKEEIVDFKTTRTLIRCVVAGIAVLVMTFVGCNVHIDRKISQCITEGNDPILCRMALEGDGYSRDRVVIQMLKELQIERK